MFFSANKIFLDEETVAEKLRQARQGKSIKLLEVAAKLKINIKYLEALESGEYDKLPAGVYGKNFLREYAIFLGLNYQTLILAFEAETESFKKTDHSELFSNQRAKSWHLLATPKIFKNALILIVLLLFFSYLWYVLQIAKAPPLLIINSPAENSVTSQDFIEVGGRVAEGTDVSVNGESILRDVSGGFYKKVNLKNGLNVISIAAKKRFGQEIVVERHVLKK